MAYTHSKYEVEMQRAQPATAGGATLAGGGANMAVTTVAAEWGPGYVPHLIRGAALIMTGTNLGAFTGGAVPVQFEADISTPGTATKLFTIALPSAVTDHSNKAVYYTPSYVIEVKPGMTVAARPTTAATAGILARCVLYVEPRWEEASNVTTMIATT